MFSRFISVLIITVLAMPVFADVRQEIDAKRVDLFDKKNLELSREFIKLDSNYYVGWMYESAARYFRAQDQFGYQLTINSLEKAMAKFEKDYKSKLSINSTDILAYIDAYPRQFDYTFMAYHLFTSYMAIEQIDKAHALAKKVLKFKMMNYLYFEPYNHLSWIAHRSRTSTSKEHRFLKDNVLANEYLALSFLDSADASISKNYSANALLFGEKQTGDKYNYNHFYRSMIYTYLSKTDSAEMFFGKLKNTPHFSHNNYAYLKIVEGDFLGAEKEFLVEKELDDPSEKRTKEFTYMLSLLNIYKGMPRGDVDSLPNYINQRGEIPGFGWDNIALARSCYYAGYHKKSKQYLAKAESFSELHLNTTWSPEQYNYAVSLLKYLNSNRDIDVAKFQNKYWWCNIPTLLELPKLYLKKMSNHYKLTSDFASNKERELAFYQLFNSECVITFDEIWATIEGYNTQFFIKKYKDYANLENRAGVRRYYNYILAKLYFKTEQYDKALTFADLALNDTKLDKTVEILLQSRIHELKALVFEKYDNKSEMVKHRNLLFAEYPSLLMFSKIDKPFKIVKNSNQPKLNRLVDEFLNCGVVEAEANDNSSPVLELSLEKTDKGEILKYKVLSDGAVLREGGFMAKENAGILLAYKVFGVDIDDVEVYDKNNMWLIAGVVSAIALLWFVYTLRKRRAML
jgi:hypothetical protein